MPCWKRYTTRGCLGSDRRSQPSLSKQAELVLINNLNTKKLVFQAKVTSKQAKLANLTPSESWQGYQTSFDCQGVYKLRLSTLRLTQLIA